jgi:hypothetical protein
MACNPCYAIIGDVQTFAECCLRLVILGYTWEICTVEGLSHEQGRTLNHFAGMAEHSKMALTTMLLCNQAMLSKQTQARDQQHTGFLDLAGKGLSNAN